MPGFSVYLFDFDGTIAATRPAGIACLTRTLAERGATVSEARIDGRHRQRRAARGGDRQR